MYVSMDCLLKHAAQHYYAVMAANALNMEMVRGVISAADETQSPLIIILGSMAMAKHATPELIAPMVIRLAQQTSVPIALCLDHGKDIQKVSKALYNRFSSVMIDASQLPMEENIALTRSVVELCHPLGVGVEGELGHVGQAAALDGRDASLYTRPEDACRFARETGVDCLAVAIGSAHGKYPQGFRPSLNFDLLRQIKDATGNMPIALHGGSGSGDENIVKAVEAGINKINLATDLQEACKNGAIAAWQSGRDYMKMIQASEQACKELLMHWMQLAGSCGQARHFVAPYCFSQLQGDMKNTAPGE